MKAAMTSALQTQCATLLEQIAKVGERSRSKIARRLHNRSAGHDVEVARAWDELRDHPALLWVPPMWRTDEATELASRHIVRAVDKNLFVEITSDQHHPMMVQLRTGPLHDRMVGDGLDPVTPVASVNPDLTVRAPSFEQAVLELRDVVVAVYGATTASRFESHPDSSLKDGRHEEPLSGRWYLTGR